MARSHSQPSGGGPVLQVGRGAANMSQPLPPNPVQPPIPPELPPMSAPDGAPFPEPDLPPPLTPDDTPNLASG